jgi:hypothetical protein
LARRQQGEDCRFAAGELIILPERFQVTRRGGVIVQRIEKMLPAMAIMLLLWACGPDTILVRPELDTPALHVANGKKLLERGKIQPAYQEFMRAKELNPNYAPLYVGIGLVQGHKGDLAAGLESMAHAREIAKTSEEREWIEQGYRQLYDMFEGKSDTP